MSARRRRHNMHGHGRELPTGDEFRTGIEQSRVPNAAHGADIVRSALLAHTPAVTSQVVFLSLFLGLLAGPHPVELQVGRDVHTVRILLAKHPVAVLDQPPWRATIDFGPSIVPGELVAVGYDEGGNEIARATQLINIPRPVAEFNITLQNDDSGVPSTAQFKWEHLVAAQAVSSSLSIDSKPVQIDKKAIARLPRLDMKRPHLIAGEMKFDDGFVTRREIVVGGELTDTADTEMTPVGIRQTG